MSKDLAASVRARLLNIAKTEQSDFNQVLVRYALERILYRLSQSAYADQFLLKGALLFVLWYDMPHRHTRDADLLGFGPSDLDTIATTFRDIASVVVNDGIVFNPDSVRVEEIRKEAGYGGARVLIDAGIAKAHCKTQVDIGFGDAVTPAPVVASFPVLLDEFPAPKLRTYPVYTVVAEKLHAIAMLGMTNTRLKDYFDLHVLIERETLDDALLAQAVFATFTRRGTSLSGTLLAGLSDEFAGDKSRNTMWQAFLKKNELNIIPLTTVVAAIRARLHPALLRASENV